MNRRFTSKKLISFVRPGVWLTRANALRRTSLLIRLDLPTFERPANATSGMVGSGRQPPGAAIPPMNSSERMMSGSVVSVISGPAAPERRYRLPCCPSPAARP